MLRVTKRFLNMNAFPSGMLLFPVQHEATHRGGSKPVPVCRASGVSLFESVKLEAL